MPQSDFIHLHVHTQFSLLDGACRIRDIVQKAVEHQMPALGMTDHGNLFGALDFYQACTNKGIKPIIGVEAYVAPGSRFEKKPGQGGTSHLLLLAKDEGGYRNLLKLVSAGYLEGFYYKPRIDKEILRQHSKGLLASSACLRGEVSWHLREGRFDEAARAAEEYASIFEPGDFYLEVMDHGLKEQRIVNEGMRKLSKQLNLPLVATNDVHYLDQGQWKAHDVLLCIQTQSFLSDEKRMRLPADQFYFKSPEEMRRLFEWAPEALANTLEIAEKCNLKLDFGQYHLPRYDPPAGMTQKQHLENLCREGVKNRYGKETPEIRQRLDHELEIIEHMGFVSYFLIVWDFIHYAKEKGIPVGPGRGSAAGSIVSYLLGITDLDPLRYGLLFERFLNPDRAGMPDIDIDFCFERRNEVIDYVTHKYGEKNVAQIITFGTMQAKAAVRDVGRVMGVPYPDVDRLAKMIPLELGITLEKALATEPQLTRHTQEDRTAGEIVDMARVLEGLTRHASIHAAGVVISDRELTDHVPLFKTSEGQITTGFSMEGIAKIGLLKMDFLGLRTLTVIDKAIKWIKKTRNIDVDIASIPMEDRTTFELLSRAKSGGIFQLESTGMRELLKKIKPNEFEDLIAILALYRPGPMGSGMLEDFILRKRGDIPVKYPHPKLETVLKETFGITVYQEQVMQMASILAGFSMSQADNLRRAMSKKKTDVMERMRHLFVEGCQKNSRINQHEANKLFDLIDYFSGYGFNKSHSAAYALISYQTAYLKANYPVEFMCALLTSEKDNTDKVVEYVEVAGNMGIKILPPHVNHSFLEFAVIGENEIRFGLHAVKNIGQSAIESIVAQRESGGPFESIYDFCERVDLRLVNRKVLESLIKCGAFDGMGAYRSQMMAVSERALELGAKSQQEKQSGQISFFGMEDDAGGFSKGQSDLPPIKEWPKNEILVYEKKYLGFYLSGHPLDRFKTEIKEFADCTTKELSRIPEGQEVKLVGILKGVKLTTTRKSNERMAILQLEDKEGVVESVVFPSVYATVGEGLVEGEVVVLIGKVGIREDAVNIIASDIKKIDEIYRSIRAINLDLGGSDQKVLSSVREKLSGFPGKIPVYLRMDTDKYKSVQILVGEDLYVHPSEHLFQEIKELLGEEKFSVTL